MSKLMNIGNWIKQNLAKVGVVLISLVLAYTLFLFFHARALNETNAHNLVDAENRIAALSNTIQENATTASRLAEQNATQMSQLQSENHDLAALIQSRNEQIASLTQVIANFHPIHIVADGSHATGSTVTDGATQRDRVDFDQTHSDYLRVSGHTMTNPSEAEIDIEFTRPLHLTIAATQDPDGQWRTYATSDYEDLQIGQIDSSINPQVAAHAIGQHQSRWTDGITVGAIGGVGTSGHSGLLGGQIGYNFSGVDISILGAGLVTPNGGDLILGAAVAIHPFDL